MSAISIETIKLLDNVELVGFDDGTVHIHQDGCKVQLTQTGLIEIMGALLKIDYAMCHRGFSSRNERKTKVPCDATPKRRSSLRGTDGQDW